MPACANRLSISALANRPFCVGFAAETEKVGEYARGKLAKKNLDMIIANKVGRDLGFDSDDNSVTVYWNSAERQFPTAAKSTLAVELVGLIGERYAERANNQLLLSATAARE